MIKNKVSVLIADDEYFGRQVVKEFLKNKLAFEIVGEAVSGEKTIEMVLNLRPDVLFLDVQMPEPNGMEVPCDLDPKNRPIVIFTTAHEEHAIKAFELGAVDYLLKPFDQPRFELALSKALELYELKKLAAASQPGGPQEQHLTRILIKEPKRMFFVKCEEIYWFEASGDYVILHTETKSHLINSSLTELEQRLNPDDFVRIHRSTILNINVISEFEPYFNGEFFIILKNRAKVKLSRSYRDKLKFLFSDVSRS